MEQVQELIQINYYLFLFAKHLNLLLTSELWKNFESQMTLSVYEVSQDRLAFQKGMKKQSWKKGELFLFLPAEVGGEISLTFRCKKDLSRPRQQQNVIFPHKYIKEIR